jgi:hypothetical protein
MKKEIKEELNAIAPILSKMKKENSTGFKMPENYFDYLNQSVMEQVRLEPQSPIPTTTKKTSFWHFLNIRPYLTAGLASFALLVTALLFSGRFFNETPITEFSVQEANHYITNHIDEFEADLLMQEVLLSDLEEPVLEPTEIHQFLEEHIDELDDVLLEQLL